MGLLALATTAAAEPGPRAIAADTVVALAGPPVDGGLRVGRTAGSEPADRLGDAAHRRPGSYCTLGTCRPRTADPTRGVLAFGGAAGVAGLLARRRTLGSA